MNDTIELLIWLGLAIAWCYLIVRCIEAALLLPAPLLVLYMFVRAIVESLQ